MNISAVLVTFNRLSLLEKVLECFENLSRKPNELIIVNNCSTDGTYDYLTNWENLTKLNVKVIHLDSNLGGSGGFHEGLKEAMKSNPDWVWLSDDDAFPDRDAFKIAEKFLIETKQDNIGAICSTVINHEEIDILHRRRLVGDFIKSEVCVPEEQYNQHYFKLDLFSYVGAIISINALEKLGITEKDYFIWYDDTEHAMRISKEFSVLCVPKIKVIHDTVEPVAGGISWKKYYGVRNKLLSYRKHYPLTFLFLLYKYTLSLCANLIKCRPMSGNKIIIHGVIHAILNKKGVDKYYYPGRKV